MSRSVGGRLDTDRSYCSDDPPHVVWSALESVEQYRSWWPWLRDFDAQALEQGARWSARIRLPLPWALRFRLELRCVSAPHRVEASLTGDIVGSASVTIARSGLEPGTTIRLQSALRPRHPLLGAVNRFLPGVSRRVHDRVVDTAFRQFAERPRADGARATR